MTGSNLNLTLTMTSSLMTSLTYEFGIFWKNSKTSSLKNLITSLMHFQAEFWINIYSRLPNQSNHFNFTSFYHLGAIIFEKNKYFQNLEFRFRKFRKISIRNLQSTFDDMRPLLNFYRLGAIIFEKNKHFRNLEFRFRYFWKKQ